MQIVLRDASDWTAAGDRVVWALSRNGPARLRDFSSGLERELDIAGMPLGLEGEDLLYAVPDPPNFEDVLRHRDLETNADRAVGRAHVGGRALAGGVIS